MAEDEIGKILDLLRLAEDARTPANEAEAALRAAYRRMRQTSLTREALRKEKHKREKNDSARLEPGFGPGTIVVGDPMLIVTNHGSSYRVAVIHPSCRGYTSKFVLLPKRYIRHMVYMTTEEKEELGWGASDTITRAVVLDESYLQDSVIHGWRTWH